MASPPHQQSTGCDLVYKNKPYPPKLVVRIANRLANGRELWNFSGGVETNTFLEGHDFTIVPKAGAAGAAVFGKSSETNGFAGVLCLV